MANQRIVYISGSPRKISNTDTLLKLAMAITGGQFIKLSECDIKPCEACWRCRELGHCIVDDDMTKNIVPLLLQSDGIVIGSPVFFNNVSAQTKLFIDRTWCIRGSLRNKIGGAIVVGRKYGAESALVAIEAFFLKHEMLIANRGVCGVAYEKEEIFKDTEAIKAAKLLGKRIKDLGDIINPAQG